MYEFANYLTDAAIDAILAEDFLTARRFRNGRNQCALAVGLTAMGVTDRLVTHGAPTSNVLAGWLFRLRGQLASPTDPEYTRVQREMSLFVGDFDKGRLLGDALVRALGRDPEARAAVAVAEAIIGRTAVEV